MIIQLHLETGYSETNTIALQYSDSLLETKRRRTNT